MRVTLWTFLLIWFLAGCNTREHTNIFDPQNPADSMNIGLQITASTDQVVALSWQSPGNVDYTGFNIYRKIAGQNSFSKLATVCDTCFHFSDSAVVSDKEHLYYLTVQGKDKESIPSKSVTTVPGPGTFWLLDREDYTIYHVTYDLRHVLNTKYTIGRPQAMCFNGDYTRALVVYSYFRYMELFDVATGNGLKGFDDLTRPYDCIYNPFQKTFWIVDASAGGLYSLSPSGTTAPELIGSAPESPVQIRFGGGHLYFVLDSDRNSVWVFDSDGAMVTELSDTAVVNMEQPQYIAASPDSQILLIIDQRETERVLIKYDYAQRRTEEIFRSPDLALAAFDSVDSSIWLALNSANSSKIVQLSIGGQRLVEKGSFTHISDLLVSPYTGHLLIADGWAGVLYHFRRDFTLVGSSKTAYYPYKVYSQ